MFLAQSEKINVKVFNLQFEDLEYKNLLHQPRLVLEQLHLDSSKQLRTAWSQDKINFGVA